MKTSHAIRLGEYVLANKDRLTASNRPTLSTLADQIGESLGFKVSDYALRDAMQAFDIPTRKQSQKDSERLALLAENERLQADNNALRQVIAKVLAAEYVPEDLKDYVFAGLPAELRESLTVDV